MTLDHLVINTLFGIDAARAAFAGVDQPFDDRPPASYLEVVGVPASVLQRQEVLDSPEGLSGLVFRAEAAEATYVRLTDAGFAPQEPILLERPVELGGTTRQAKFRNVRMASGEFPAGRVYFCRHLTPGRSRIRTDFAASARSRSPTPIRRPRRHVMPR